MPVDWHRKVFVNFSQYDGIKKLLEILPDFMNGLNNTAAPKHIFKTDDKLFLLDPVRIDQYHTITTKSLLFSQRSIPNTQSTTGFHCARVKKPRKND